MQKDYLLHVTHSLTMGSEIVLTQTSVTVRDPETSSWHRAEVLISGEREKKFMNTVFYRERKSQLLWLPVSGQMEM